jgi:hypothetical protein
MAQLKKALPMDCYLGMAEGLCLFDLKKADQRQFEIK